MLVMVNEFEHVSTVKCWLCKFARRCSRRNRLLRCLRVAECLSCWQLLPFRHFHSFWAWSIRSCSKSGCVFLVPRHSGISGCFIRQAGKSPSVNSLLYISPASDTIFEILVKRLSVWFGISNIALSWFRSCLSFRSCSVKAAGDVFQLLPSP